MSSSYLSNGLNSEGLLLHGTGAKPRGSEIDVTLVYGDYYFVEALQRYQEIDARRVPLLPGALGLSVLCVGLGGMAIRVLTIRRM